MNKMILASNSSYRRAQVEAIGINIEQIKPLFDETAAKIQLLKAQKSPQQIAEELAYEKGASVLATRPLVSGECLLSGDQLIHFNGQIYGQPQSFENAFLQLQSMNNQWHELITAVVLFRPAGVQRHTEIIRLKMRLLSEIEIKNYLVLDEPYNCAGSYKFEKNGHHLFEKIEGHDHSSIQGVPMLWLTEQLKENSHELITK